MAKNLCNIMTFAVELLPRSFDSLMLAQDDKTGDLPDECQFILQILTIDQMNLYNVK